MEVPFTSVKGRERQMGGGGTKGKWEKLRNKKRKGGRERQGGWELREKSENREIIFF